ncbi:PQQ-binding-like beta-propeller repeat protein [Parvularcula dongshanensis]|uniref:Outer membrane protein assembly factor BamB n=1 Tax=Parvularcula dongshanensis TaxID=1173995 RepID=A0A840I3X6_9PROT|nr:PQQ-binding-like beta-propeller repeat protein [Parvularcula dongshanensis]MBB4659035.1 outer membrane protein assembly factor BamB [Parvularcula dongshanensis]
MGRRSGEVAALCLLLTACASNPLSGLFGNRDASEIDEDPENERIAVLATDQALTPDPAYIAVPIVLPPPYANAEWTQPGGEADHTMHHLAAPSSFALAWRADIGAGGTDRSPLTAPPVVGGGRVFTVDNAAQVTAFDAGTGKVAWRTALTPDVSEEGGKFWKFWGGNDPKEIGFGGGVALDGGRVFMVTGFATAAALDQDTGEVLWKAQLPAPVRNPPTVADGRVFAVTVSNQIVALDQATGETVWTYESFEETARFLSSASPAVDGDTVIVPFSSGEVVALQAENGRVLWSATVGRASRMNALADLNDIAGAPVVDRGAVFAVSHSDQISAIDLRTGQTAWEKPVGGLNMPWVAGDTVFMVSTSGNLVALARNDGGVRWVRQLPAYENEKKRKKPISWSGPVLAGGNLILASSRGGLLLASPLDGATVAEFKAEETTVPPVVAGGTLYLLDEEGRLSAYRQAGVSAAD